MRYADTLLAEGETVVLRARQHWLALLIEARVGVALLALGAVLLVAAAAAPLQGDAVRNLVSIAALGALLVGFLVLAWNAWQWWSQDYLITNRRILKVEGILNKRSSDSSLEKINDAVLHQNIWGRIFGYGDLDILTAAEGAIDRYRMLHQAPGFKREMLNQKHALETEFSYRLPPSPPLRADSSDHRGRDSEDARPGDDNAYRHVVTPVSGYGGDPARRGAPDDRSWAAPAGSASRATSPPSVDGPRSSNADPVAITQTLARLADLRDRGAISAEEYDAKKNDLLARL